MILSVLAISVLLHLPLIQAEADKNQIHPLLLVALIQHESEGDTRARSDDGKDCGLMQLRTTGAGLGYKCRQLFNPALNIRLGSAYLAGWIRECGGNLTCALASYNAGHKLRTSRYGREVYSEYRALRRRSGQFQT